MAKVDLQGIRLESYANGWKVGPIRVRTSGKAKGEEYIEPISYCGSLSAALRAASEHRLRQSEANTLKALYSDLQGFRAELTRHFKLTLGEQP